MSHSAELASRPRTRLILAVVATAACAGAVLLWRSYHTPLTATRQPPNILLITIDTLRWDHLGCYGDKQASTPAIDGLARSGVRFVTGVAHVPLTAPSHASILTGRSPLKHGVRDNGAYELPRELPTIASILSRAGYATAAFVSGFPLDHRFGFATGFDVYDDRLVPDAGRAPYTERPADATTDRALAWIDRRAAETQQRRTGEMMARPWFAWVHYFDPHAPYAPPGEFARAFAERPYDGEIAFVDAQVGRLLRHADRESNTLVLVTADHGESFGEHGEETHGVFVYDATLRVPFIVAGPGVAAGRTSSVVARGIDVLPTLLDLAGVGAPAGVDGRSLRAAVEGSPMADEPAYVESLLAARHLGWAPLQGIRTAGWKYIHAPRPELYDLGSDAREERNRIDDDRRGAAQLDAQLRVATEAARTPDAQARATSGAMTRLRALGYLSGGASSADEEAGRDPKDGIGLITRLEQGVAESSVNPREALVTLEAVLREEPDAALGHRYLAVARMALGQHPAAIEQLEWLDRRGQASADDLLMLAESHRALGRDGEARQLVARAALMDPGSPEPPLTEARADMASGRVADAATAYQRALVIAPDHPEALRGLGETALARGDAATATSYFERAHDRDPEDGVTALRLAVLYARRGQPEAALPLLQAAVQQIPGNGEALAALGAALARTGRAGEAVPYFQRAVDAGLRTPAVLNGLGFARLEAGDTPGALAALQASLQLRADQPQVQGVVQQLTRGVAPGELLRHARP